jgi:tetratricopeptide (TPR) repeat protein
MGHQRLALYVLLGVLVFGAVVSFLFGSYAYEVNRAHGFPLDDPWIHLQFARNLHDYGSFSYYKDEMTTSGSTSPLYTFMLALGFFVTSNEMMLSYVLGVVFLLGAAVYLYRIVVVQTDSRSNFPVLAFGAAVLFLVEMRMQWAALSGMETTLFILLLLAVLYYYKARKALALGIASGLLLWTRPEAVIMVAALALDALYHRLWVRRAREKSSHKQKRAERQLVQSPAFPLDWLGRPAVVFGLIAAAYVAFNLSLSGSIFPNTFAAKLKYYGGGVKTGFPQQVFHFLTDGHMLPVALCAALAVVGILVGAVRRKAQSLLVPFLFCVGMVIAYWMKLPYLYQEGRYMMPILPFVMLLAVEGVRMGAERVARMFSSREKRVVLMVQVSTLVILIVPAALATWDKRREYAEMCRYISERQVRTAHWLREHTPPEAVIATHDIGAIAFYSGRRIADMVGLVSPEMIERMGSLDRLRQFLLEKKVTHLAVLRNWFEVVNQTPLFKTNEREPEIMEVFAFDPKRTHLTSQDVTRAVAAAGQYMYQGQFRIAEDLLVRAQQIDPLNSKVHHLLGMLHLAGGRLDQAEAEFTTALRLYPEFLEAQIGLAQIAARQNKTDDALTMLLAIAREHPSYPAVFRALADVYRFGKRDTLQANAYMQRFTELMQSESSN